MLQRYRARRCFVDRFLLRTGKTLKIQRGRGTDFPGGERRGKGRRPPSGLAAYTLGKIEDRQRVTISPDHELAFVVDVDKRAAGVLAGNGLGVRTLLRASLLGMVLVDPTPHQKGEIDRVTKQGAQIVDWRLSALQVVPGGFDHIGEALAVFTRFPHELENQEIKKTQGPKALKVRRHVAWLSLLKNRRA